MNMKEKKKLFNIATYGQMLIDIILFALGVYSASNPTSSNTVIGVAFGISLSVVGIYNIIKYIFNIHRGPFFIVDIVYGVLSIIAGIFIIINPLSLTGILSIGIGLWLIVSASFKFALALQLRKFAEETWLFSLVVSILVLILGIIVMINPFSTALVLTTFVGIMMCVYSSIDFLQQILFRRRVKEIIDIFFE